MSNYYYAYGALLRPQNVIYIKYNKIYRYSSAHNRYRYA